MLLQRRDAPAPRLSRTAARLPKALDPDNRRAGTDINLLGRRAPRRPAFNFRNHSRPHVFRIGLRHRPASQNRINADRLSHPSPSENLLDSIGTEHALGHPPSAMFGAFMNLYLCVGSRAVGAVDLADRIENWDPEHQAKLRQVGLRSSFELDDEEGHVFIALSADRYPIGVMGRRNAVGDLFVSRVVTFPHRDFAIAIDDIKQSGVELILGSAAKELLCKMEQVKVVAPRADKI